MKEDYIASLFEEHRAHLDVHETPQGHQARFMGRLQETPVTRQRTAWWKPLTVAASVILVLSLGMFSWKGQSAESDLASISPEMAQTQSFFTTAINDELSKLKSLESQDTKQLVEDALQQLTILETEYQSLKEDLVVSGSDKRVIAAMVSNLQNRISLLEHVLSKVEEINNLKATQNELIL
ncbi:hypothetical protein [Altibacter sp. HG106]|uniref:hypothetical protein n=1 Tax=Altibacter sp. HG106 TaxID=3023937 RepID=UPI0023503701|nr:hypothetical protein [Altibacter sp. HG106]MDC7996200.1 hypothetical protein [Altibacter sp. HG106]